MIASTKAVYLCLAALMIAAVWAASATPATVPVTATVNAGALSGSSSATPSVSVTLNGTDQTPTYTAPLAANDETGSGSGWNLTISSTQFSTGGGSPKTLSTSASAINSINSACTQGTCTSTTNSVGYPVLIPAGSSPTPVKFFNASANTGMGDFTITPTVAVSVPANAFAGTYSSTLTIAVASGP
jgi:hypothetical protein